MAKDKRKGGRVTPPKGSAARQPARRRLRAPERIGPFQKPDPDRPLGQVGRRPSSPGKLALFGVVYLAAGIAAFFVLKGTLKIVFGVVFIGMSLLWFRGAATAYVRQQRRPE